MSTQAKRIEGLDGLRALACLAVFGVHFQQITGLAGQMGPLDVKRFLLNGNTGVSLFFTLSGFLLSLPFWRGDLSAPGRPWLVRYIRNRVVRILPPYYLCLTVLVIHQRHWASRGELLDTLSHYLFLHNYSERFFYHISSPFWTIAVQVQFYLLLPLLFWLLCRVTSKEATRVSVILALSVACYVLHYFVMERGDRVGALIGVPDLVTARETVFSHSVLAHLPHLLWGVLAAWVYQKLLAARPNMPRGGCEATVWLSGLAILAILATSLDEVFQVPHGRYNFPYVPALIAAIIACTPVTAGARRVLELWPLSRLGEISYGVFIFHLPCMRLVARALGSLGFSAQRNWLLYAAVSLALSIVVATISYLAIERPLLRYMHRRRDA